MKCRNCGINYDDEEKECPMCGTKTGKGTRIAVSKYSNYSHTVHSPDECTHKTFTKEQNFTGARSTTGSMGHKTVLGGGAEKPRSSGIGLAFVVIVVLLSLFGPMLLSFAGNVARRIQYEYVSNAPAPESVPPRGMQPEGVEIILEP